MNLLTLSNPVFAAYVAAAALMILKGVAMSWVTVIQMTRANGGFRAPEDLRKTPFNPNPRPDQLQPDERVERIRRIQMNDLENLPYFLVAGLLFVFTQPSVTLARWLFYGYVATRLAHFAAYVTAQAHEVRALFWTPGSLIVLYMAGTSLAVALGWVHR